VADVIRDAMEWLADQQALHQSRVVTYTRGANSVALTVTLARTQSTQLDGDGRLRTTYTGRAYLIRPAELILGGSLTTPQKGDRIADVNDAGAAETYEVQPPGTGQPAFEPDAYSKRLRVHTKRVA